jgi:hypothetical protein
MMIRYWRSGAVAAAAALALAALGLAACGGGSSPRVANLGDSSGNSSGSTTTTLPKGNPTQLLDEWASCMRAHGTPDISDPTIDANGVIHITMPASGTGSGAAGFKSSEGVGGGGPCSVYLTTASTALRGGQPLQKPDPARLEKFSQCMRANGIPDFPDPTGQGLRLSGGPGSDLNPNNPTFKTASKLCAKKAGVPGLGGAGPQKGGIEVTGGGPRGAGGPGSGGGSGPVIQGG